jgi:hypothetical protein
MWRMTGFLSGYGALLVLGLALALDHITESAKTAINRDDVCAFIKLEFDAI